MMVGRLRRLIGGNADADLFVESFVSPLRADREAVAIVPGGSNGIEAVRSLFTPSEREGPVYGGVAISRNGRFESFLVGTVAYHAGEARPISIRDSSSHRRLLAYSTACPIVRLNDCCLGSLDY